VQAAAPPAQEVAFRFENEILVVSAGLPWSADLIETAERVALWNQATIANAKDTPYHHTDRNNDVLTVSGAMHPDLAAFEKNLDSVFGQCAGLYKALNSHLTISHHTGFQLLRYKPGQHFNIHVDNIAGHTTWGQRQLSIVLYLNEDYIGGEIDFPRQKRRIKAKAGDVVLFPSHFTHPHASLDVQAGVKYAVVTWYV
jgi:predicted 2-oxoglutarate/Fe(II)-dependent dioxygenase YbiX